LQHIEQKLSNWRCTREVEVVRKKLLKGSKGKLKKRWDNAPHHPQVKTYPHHLHAGSEEKILACEAMSLDKVLKSIEKNIKH